MNDDWKNDAQQQEAIRKTWHLIEVGDRLTIALPHGGARSGSVVMKFPTHCVLNGGGRYGTPLVADPANIIKHAKARRKETS